MVGSLSMNKNWIVRLVQYGKYTVYHNDGVVVCSCPMWDATHIQTPIVPGEVMAGSCDHTWKAIKEGRDVDEDMGALPRGDVYVPLFFGREGTRSGLWVHIDPTFERNGMIPFLFRSSHPEIQKFPHISDELLELVRKPIGWIEPHEGRWNIRSATLEWLRGVYFHLPRCTFTYHAVHLFSSAEREKKNADSKQPDVLVSVMSMLEKGICSACAAAGADPTIVDDLVPDV